MSQLRSLLEDVVGTPVDPIEPTWIVTRGRRRRRWVLSAQVATTIAVVALVPALFALAPTSNVPTIEPAAPDPAAAHATTEPPRRDTPPSERAVAQDDVAMSTTAEADDVATVTPTDPQPRTEPAPGGAATTAPDEPQPRPTVSSDGPLISESPRPSPTVPTSGPDNCRIDAETSECRYTARSAGGYRVYAVGQWTLTVIRDRQVVAEIHSETANACGDLGIIQPGDLVWLEEGHRTGPTRVSTETTPEVGAGADHHC